MVERFVLNVQFRLDFGGQAIEVEVDGSRAESVQPLCQLAANPPHADNAICLLVQLIHTSVP